MHNHVVLGGTFDHLHCGHRDLLSMAFSKSKKVTLGLTKASMNTKKEACSYIQSYAVREKEIIEFACSLGREKDLTVIPIHDIYGKTLQDNTLEAIIVTPHTLGGAQIINQKRKELNLSLLAIETCPLRQDCHGGVISSSRIRRGEIDRNGVRYLDLFSTDVLLSDEAREVLQRPIGKAVGAVKLKQLQSPLIVVGDISTQYVIDHQIPFYVAWTDGKTHKKSFQIALHPPYTLVKLGIQNLAGGITSLCAQQVYSSFGKSRNTAFSIEGEEDLLTVAAVILFPLGTRVVYGYPFSPQSLRCITVTERTKTRFAHLLFPMK